MLRVALINMPFANLNYPSIALTQLKSVLEREHAGQVSADILYLNHDFVELFGLDGYQEFGNSHHAQNAGFGEWLFRQAAFPELPDNSEAYFKRYFPHRTAESERLKLRVAAIRQRADDFIEGLIDRHGLDRYDLAGLTSTFMQNLPSFALARHLKQRNPQIVTAMGGANCEAPMGQEIVRHVPAIDYVFSGPALKSFPAFVRCLLAGAPEECQAIQGVFSKGNVAAHQGRGLIGEELCIDELVTLDYDDFVKLIEERYPGRAEEIILTFETSRGCWWGERSHCTFCGLNGLTMSYRAMQPENAVNLISSLFRYSPKKIRLESVDNILPKHYLSDVFPRLQTPESMYLFYEVKADLTEQEMAILSNARVKVLQPGIEALATSTLKLMKKGTTSFGNLTFLINCLIYNIHPVWNLLIGFPGEGAEVYEAYLRDLPKLVHLPPPNGAFPVRFDRYSPYFKEAQAYGLDLRPLPFYELTYPFPKESLDHLAYYFADQNYDADYFRTVVQYVTRLQQAVASWRQRWEVEPQPRLYLDGPAGDRVVRDSRGLSEVSYPVSETAEQLLCALARRKGMKELTASLPHLAEPALAQELAALNEKGLIFEENNRYQSLVLPRQVDNLIFYQTKAS